MTAPQPDPDPQPVPDLGALIAQRLCHDLVNPLGAIANGLELLAMSQPPSPEMTLMQGSLDQALGRIKLYRLAFGAAPTGARMAGADLAAALEGLGGSRRIELALDLPADLARTDARLVAILALCAETALAWGGRLSIRLDDAPGAGLSLTAEAPRLRQDPDLWAALDQGQVPPSASPPQVQFALAPQAARAAARPLRAITLPDRIEIRG
jgi:histidine phosphotransferase ChpT